MRPWSGRSWPWRPTPRARGATIRRNLTSVAARAARHGRGHLTLHLPGGWHRRASWLSLLEALRPAPGKGGLTSPDPVTGPANGHAPPTASHQNSDQETRTSRRPSKRHESMLAQSHKITSVKTLPAIDHLGPRGLRLSAPQIGGA